MSSKLSATYDPSVIDRAAMLDRVGGDEELLAEIAGIFLTEYPQLLEEIRTALATANPTQLERSAHSLKGAVSNFGAYSASQAALQLEQIGRQKRLDGASDALACLEYQLAVLHPALAKYVHS